jgi:crossover junction endodeoxyribonuclease RusA
MIKLPIPPSTNMLYRNVPGRGRAKTKRYMEWINAAGWDMNAQRPPKHDGKITLDITVQKKDKRKRDISNFVKAVEDLLVSHSVIVDDSLVQQVTVRWSTDIEGCEVRIEDVCDEV